MSRLPRGGSARSAALPDPAHVAGPVGAGVDEGGRAAVLGRDRVYRRALMLADGLAAFAAVYVAVVVLGDDTLQLASLLTIPLAVVVSKVLGLYDRDELLIRKTTLDESPALFQLAAVYTLLDLAHRGARSSRATSGTRRCSGCGAASSRSRSRADARRARSPAAWPSAERCLVARRPRGHRVDRAQALGRPRDEGARRRPAADRRSTPSTTPSCGCSSSRSSSTTSTA